MTGSDFRFKRLTSSRLGSLRSNSKQCPLSQSYHIYRSQMLQHFNQLSQTRSRMREWLCPYLTRLPLGPFTRQYARSLPHQACQRMSLSSSEESSHLKHRTPRRCPSSQPAGTITSKTTTMTSWPTWKHSSIISDLVKSWL